MSRSQLTLAAQDLPSQSLFTLTVSKGMRNATTEVLIEVVGTEMLIVELSYQHQSIYTRGEFLEVVMFVPFAIPFTISQPGGGHAE